MELLQEPRTARHVRLLAGCRNEVLVLTSQRFLKSWTPELVTALAQSCARGVRLRVLVEGGRPDSLVARALAKAGADLRFPRRGLVWALRSAPLQGETWIYDRSETVTVNEHRTRPFAQDERFPALACRMGAEVAVGAASYFDLYWESSNAPLGFSVRHKRFALHSGSRAEDEFFACLLGAKREVVLSLPAGALGGKLEQAMRQLLRFGLRVVVYANADRDSTRAVRRLKRLAEAGATVKICGVRLSSECALIDDHWVYYGTLPRSWRPWLAATCPAFLLQNAAARQTILETLEEQVSIEFNSAPAPAL